MKKLAVKWISNYMDIITNINSRQIENLVDNFSTDNHLANFYDYTQTQGLGRMTVAQYWYVIRLWKLNSYLQLKKILDKFLNHK